MITPLFRSSIKRSWRNAASAGVASPSRTLRCARQAISAIQIADEYRPSAWRASPRTSLPPKFIPVALTKVGGVEIQPQVRSCSRIRPLSIVSGPRFRPAFPARS